MTFVNSLSSIFKDVSGASLFSEITAKECYLCSKLIIVDEEKPTAAKTAQTLNFEDFLEAIVRLSNCVKTSDIGFENQDECSNDPNTVARRLDMFLIKLVSSEKYKHPSDK